MLNLLVTSQDLRACIKNLDHYPRAEQKQILEKLAFDCYIRKGALPPQLIALQKLAATAKPGFKFNPYHDELGRFTFASGGGENGETDNNDENSGSGSNSVGDRIDNFLLWALGIATAHAQEPDINEEDNKPAEGNDILGDIKIGYYQDALSTLRQLDPNNHDFDSISGPDWVPSDDDINRLNEAISAASQQRVTNFAVLDGQPVGEEGNGDGVRILPGGLEQAQRDFEFLTVGGTIRVAPTYQGILMNLPGNYGIVGLRPLSTSGPPSLDFKKFPAFPSGKYTINEGTMDTIDDIVEGIARGITEDACGIWWIAWIFRDRLKIQSDAEVKEKSFDVIRKLMERNIMPGNLADKGGFTFWEGAPDALLARIEAEWPKTGIPQLSYTECWFALKKA